jgi:hypothetical protein
VCRAVIVAVEVLRRTCWKSAVELDRWGLSFVLTGNVDIDSGARCRRGVMFCRFGCLKFLGKTVGAHVLRNCKRKTGKKYVDRGPVECAWLLKQILPYLVKYIS